MPKIHKTGLCQICNKEKRLDEMIQGGLIRKSVFEEIRSKYPHFDADEYICGDDLDLFRYEHIRLLLEAESGELSALDKEILEAIQNHETLSKKPDEHEEHIKLSDRLSDKIARFGGSWKFIIFFVVVLIGWMIVNIYMGVEAFDQYPFILLNLVLSSVAALQAPIIMMSQNRQAAKDRHREEQDYKVNLKAELEIRMLHEKLDKLMTSQWQRLIEIQQIQMDFMQQLSHRQK